MNKSLKNLIAIFFLFFILIKGAYSMQYVKYIVEYQSNNVGCTILVNDVKALWNNDYQGPMMAGVTMSAFLGNGINTISLNMVPISSIKEGYKNYQSNSSCELIGSKIILHETSKDEIELFKLIGSVDEDLQPTGKQSPNYEDNQVVEYPIDGTDFYQVSKSFVMNGLPEWTWTKAISFEPTEENMQKLREAYLEVWQAINTKNEQRFKELSYISFSEKELAANYPGSWYVSLDLDKLLARSHGAMPINWDDYKLVILNKEKLVKLENEQGFSPLGFKNQDDKLITSYNPYFSLIDNKMVLTR